MFETLLQFDNFSLKTIWIFEAVAIITTTWIIIHYGNRHALKMQFLSQHSPKIILLGLLGARLAGIISNFNFYFANFSRESIIQIFRFWDKNFKFWGAAIFATTYFFYLCKKHNKSFLKWLDTLAPAIILGLAIIHFGNFFDGANYGTESSLPWAVNFENPKVKYTSPIHPTQIYAFLYSLLTIFIVWQLNKSKKIIEHGNKGIIGLSSIAIYNFFRFLEEFIRGDDTILLFNSIRLPQIVALLLCLASTATLIYQLKSPSQKIYKSNFL